MIREFRQQGRVNVLVWKVEVRGDTVHVWHGVLDSPRLQHTEDRKYSRNVGRSNVKLPGDVALEEAERLILDKTRGGYVEYIDGNPMREIADSFSLSELPVGLTFYKPYNTMSAYMLNLLEKGEAWAVRKRNGDAMFVSKTRIQDTPPKDYVTLVSRRMIDHAACEDEEFPYTQRFPHIAEEASWALPDGTMLLGEIVSSREHDDKKRVNSLVKSKTELALQLQEDRGWAYFYVWDVAFHEGKDIISVMEHGDRLCLARDLVKGLDWFLPPDVYEFSDFAPPGTGGIAGTLREEAIQLGWEGWVIIDPHGKLGDRAWNMRGKTDRDPKVSCKLKPYYECDAVAYWDPENGIGEYGTGRYQGQVKSLALYQYNSGGELIHIGQVSSGLSAKQKKDLADPSIYPLVVEVRYDEKYYESRGDGSNKLYVPRFVQFRDDKDPEECVDPDL